MNQFILVIKKLTRKAMEFLNQNNSIKLNPGISGQLNLDKLFVKIRYYMIILAVVQVRPVKKQWTLFYDQKKQENRLASRLKGMQSATELKEKIYYIFNNTRIPPKSKFLPKQTRPNQLRLDSFCFLQLNLESMSIQNCPVLRPTWKEFRNFSQFVEKIDKLYKRDYGMVKDLNGLFLSLLKIIQVIPPHNWKPASSEYSNRLNGLMINGPIEQNIFGKGGVYQCLHIQKKSLSLKEYQVKMGVFDKITEDLSADQVQEMFWKNIVFSPPLYGADLLSTLMDQTAGAWNLNQLDSVLKHAIKSNVRGVTNPYCYVGSWKTLFCWHKQDLDLSAINYLHEGKSKFWYSIPYQQSSILQKEAKNYFPEHFSKCSQYLRHKTTLINPYSLKKKYPQLKISKVQHKPGEFILVFGGSYHCGFNFGFNIAEAVNYATLNWLQKLTKSKSCNCTKSSVRASHREILNNLLSSKYSLKEQVLALQKSVLQEEQKSVEEEQKVSEIKGVRQEFSKKIKKEKKVKKLQYRGEEYEIEDWAACDKCHEWRKIPFKIKEGGFFHCSDIGKKCHNRERVEKDYITL